MSIAETSKLVRLNCKAAKGMFKHESAVLIQGIDQHYESMIDSELVNCHGDKDSENYHSAWIDVMVINEKDDRVLIELPRQVVSGGRRIWVPKSEVSI